MAEALAGPARVRYPALMKTLLLLASLAGLTGCGMNWTDEQKHADDTPRHSSE